MSKTPPNDRDGIAELSNSQSCQALGSFIEGNRGSWMESCESGAQGGPVDDEFGASPPWVRAIGRAGVKGNFNCHNCSLSYRLCFEDTFDFNIEGLLDTTRNMPNEIRTALVAIAGGTLQCNWKPYKISGCCEGVEMTRIRDAQ